METLKFGAMDSLFVECVCVFDVSNLVTRCASRLVAEDARDTILLCVADEHLLTASATHRIVASITLVVGFSAKRDHRLGSVINDTRMSLPRYRSDAAERIHNVFSRALRSFDVTSLVGKTPYWFATPGVTGRTARCYG